MCPAKYPAVRSSVRVNSCLNCGAPVSPQFARVFGDNEDEVFGCPRCLTSTELLD